MFGESRLGRMTALGAMLAIRVDFGGVTGICTLFLRVCVGGGERSVAAAAARTADEVGALALTLDALEGTRDLDAGTVWESRRAEDAIRASVLGPVRLRGLTTTFLFAGATVFKESSWRSLPLPSLGRSIQNASSSSGSSYKPW